MELNLLLQETLLVFLEMHINKGIILRKKQVFKELIQREINTQVVKLEEDVQSALVQKNISVQHNE